MLFMMIGCCTLATCILMVCLAKQSTLQADCIQMQDLMSFLCNECVLARNKRDYALSLSLYVLGLDLVELTFDK